LTKNKLKTMESEVSSRLDDLFSETDPLDTPPNDTYRTDPDESPILDLNAIVLSIDWEITDEILARFIDEISRLKVYYRDDTILHSFLQIHGSVGKYLSTKKVNAHPGSVRLLQSLYTGFEKVVTTPEMTGAEKKKVLLAEVKKFKELKEEIRLAKKSVPKKKDTIPAGEVIAVSRKRKTIGRKAEHIAVSPEPVAETERESVPIASPVKPAAETTAVEKDFRSKDLEKKEPLATKAELSPSQDPFGDILEEVRKIIKAEFRVLKDELKLLLRG